MCEKASLNYFRDRGLLPFQAEFALSFVNEEDKPYRELVAPPGMGKTRVAAAVITRLLEERANQRILVLAPAPVLEQWQLELSSQLSSASLTVMPRILDRRSYLELEASVAVGQSPWPLPTIILMRVDLAKREDMVSSLVQTTWDLVVVDESHLLTGKRRSAYYRLIDSGVARRALLLSATEQQLKGALVTRIQLENALDWNGRPLFTSIERRLTAIQYSRSEEERAFLNELSEFAKDLSIEWAYGHLQAEIILRVASSSIYATEKLLRRLQDRWREMRNKLAHGLPWANEDFKKIQSQLGLFSGDLEEIDELPNGTRVCPEAFMTLYQKLEIILDQIEHINSDPKLEALISHLSHSVAEKGKARFCVWSSFVDTVQYLCANLGELGTDVYSLTSSVPVAEWSSRLAEFSTAGGILVATDVASTGFSFEDIDQCINYDLPTNVHLFEQRLGRFLRVGQTDTLYVAVLSDSTHSSSFEKKQLERLLASMPSLGQS